mgnify:FL=1
MNNDNSLNPILKACANSRKDFLRNQFTDLYNQYKEVSNISKLSKHEEFDASLAMKEYKQKILKTEYSEKFDEIRQNMMIMSYYKYGPLKDNYGNYKCMNAIENLKIRLQKYIDTGNTEYLADVANFAMIEFMNPQIEGACYKPTDNPDCELSGFSINEIRNFDK